MSQPLTQVIEHRKTRKCGRCGKRHAAHLVRRVATKVGPRWLCFDCRTDRLPLIMPQ